MWLINSARGIKAGVIRPNIIRPFPAAQLREALRNVKALLVGERADSYGADGGNLTHEIKAALQEDPLNRTLVLSRIFGLGGKDFYAEDAEAFFQLAIEAAEAGRVEKPFDYYGINSGSPDKVMPQVMQPPRGNDYRTGLIQVTPDEETGKLKVKVPLCGR